MPFHLVYEEEGKVRRQQFSSYYQCVVKKEQLRKKGITAKYGESGSDVTQHYENKIFGVGDKEAIKRFLKVCDNVGDLHNSKTYAKMKAKKE